MTITYRGALIFTTMALSACVLPPPDVPESDVAAGAPFVSRLGESTVQGDSVITPLAVVEDSRCPSDVMCIQAGTIRLSVKVESGSRAQTIVPSLEGPARIGSSWLHLLAACPYPQASQPTKAADYRFVLALRESSVRGEPLTDCSV